MTAVHVVDALRTPLGRLGGALRDQRPDDLAAHLLRELRRRHAWLAESGVDEVVWGAANQAGEDNRDVARMALLLADWPVEVPGVTVNRLCASGMSAVTMAAALIRSGEADVVVAGGGESMTRAPLVDAPADRGLDPAQLPGDTRLGWRLVNPELDRRYPVVSLGETAEIVAEREGIGRQAQDAFALRSHQRAHRATVDGLLADEVVPVEEVTADEGIRPDTSLAALAALPPVFRPAGTVTAGNASPLSDGAAVTLLASDTAVAAWGLAPLARIVGARSAGVHPHVMGLGPVPATRAVLDAHGWTVADLDVVEVNEAFAAQVLAVARQLGLDPEQLNQHGGAIALGHPLGCSGARLVGTVAHQLRRRGGGRGLATLCVGVGQGQSVLMEGADRG